MADYITRIDLSFDYDFAIDLWHSDRPDDHTPIGVMADHSHDKGE